MYLKYPMPRKPETQEEKEAIDLNIYNPCPNLSRGNDAFCCTRMRGHTGKHIAGGVELIYAEWNDED